MGGAGKKLHGHGARSSARSPAAAVTDTGHARPPHPIRVRVGQKFWPRAGRRRRPFVVIRVGRDGLVAGRRTDGEHEPVHLTALRLLATRNDGQGRHYSFLAWTPRRYRTWAVLTERNATFATLVLPEWHPGRAVRLPTRLVPGELREGEWLMLRADLHVCGAGQLNPSHLTPCADPGPELCHRPSLVPNAAEVS
jgi:hypothetical protein